MENVEICQHWNIDNIADSLHGRMIYKDECCRSFATPKTQGGLDVCLKCLVGHSSQDIKPLDNVILPAKSHSAIHFKNSEHPIVLRIEKVKVNSEPLLVSKLAIGKSGGIDCDADRYE